MVGAVEVVVGSAVEALIVVVGAVEVVEGSAVE